MDINNVFFQWNTTPEEYRCGELMILDAVKVNKVLIYPGHSILHKKNGLIHNEICEKHPRMAWMYDELYYPKMSKNKQYILYTNENSISLKNSGAYLRLKEKYNAKAVLVVRNPIRNKDYPEIQGRDPNSLNKEFDLIVTDEKEDANLYGWMYAPDPFSNPYGHEFEVKYDITFIGTDKGRRGELQEFAECAKKNGLKVNVIIVGGRKSENIESRSFLPYDEVVRYDLESKCILEVLQLGQTSYTLRTQEAICLGRKLITNNKEIVKESFYDKDRIFVYDSIKKIDWDFVRTPISRQVDSPKEFSAIDFFDKIEKEIC